MKKQITKVAKKVLTVCLCLLISFGSIPLSGFVGLELPDLPEINFGILKASAATQALSEDGEFYISSINTSNKTASFAGVVDETVSFTDDFYFIPSKTKYNDEIYIITGIDDSAFRNSGVKKVEIHSDITTIGDGAFRDCAVLTTVSFDERADEQTLKIGSYAFSGCSSLESVNLEDSKVTSVGIMTFADCVALEDIVLPNSLTTSGRGMFYGCKSLKNVVLGNGITALLGYNETGDDAGFFENCESLTEINIPKQVTELEHKTFKGCKKLESVVFEEGSELSFIGGYRNASLSTVPVGYIFGGCESLKTINIPQKVESIGVSAFNGCTSLETVIFEERGENGESLTLGNYVFSGCSSLKNINFEASNATSVGMMAFADCVALEDIVLPDSLTTSGRGMFYGCKSLKNVVLGNGITALLGYNETGDDAGFFENCENLTEIKIPKQVTKLEHKTFKGCKKLESVVFEDGSELSFVGGYRSASFGDVQVGYIFSGCESLKGIALPSTVVSIGVGSFQKTNISELTIPASVEFIGNSLFKDCTSLKNIIFEKRTDDQLLEIGLSAFSGCSSLEHINLQDSNTTVIKNQAFYNCKSLTSVRLPSTLETLSASAFDGCDSIKLYMDTAEPEVLVTIIDERWPFEIKETGLKDSDDRNLDSDNTYYRLTQKLSSSKNGVSLTVNYDFKETVKNNISNCNISIKVPSTVAFNTSTVTVNGVKWADVSTKNNGTLLNVNNVPASGTVEFKVILTDTSYFVSYAKIGYKLNNKSYSEVMGIINSINDMITINAPSETNKKDITVSGIASPDKEIELYINGEYIKTVMASKTGAYSETLTLPVSGNAETFTVEARINNRKNIASASVVYSNEAVMITSAKMIYRGQEYDLIANQGKLPVISWTPYSSFSFIIKVDNKDAVKAVYVVNPKAGGNNALLCEYNEELDAYTATGFKGIVPSNLSVLCITENNKDEISSKLSVDNVSDDFKESFDVDSFETEVVKNTLLEDKENGELIFRASVPEKDDLELSFKNLPTDGITSEKLLNEGYEKEQSKDGTLKYSKTTEYENGQVARTVYFEECNKIISGFAETISNPVEVLNYLIESFGGEGIELYTDIKDVTESFAEEAFENSGLDEIIFNMINTGLPTDTLELLESSKNIGGLYTQFAVKVLKLCFFEYDDKEAFKTDIIFAVAYGAGFIESLVCPHIALPTGLILGFIEILPALDAFLTSDFKFIIDPSGIVYEAVPSNTIEGATVTALWIPYDEEVPEFWSEEYPDISKAIVWDAEEYDQINPMKTLSDGSYSWEVPEGWWLVKAEKDGYETVYSEWMDIPPERFDVNLGLISNSAPKVDFINVYENEIEIAFTQYMDIESVTAENISISLNGKTVEGTFSPENEESTSDNTMSYASVFNFVPASPINGSVDIEISNVENYCGTKLEGEFSQRNNVVSKVESLSVSETVSAAINSDNTITVSAYPASAAAGKKVFLTLSNDLIASVDCNEITLDENGEGVVNVHAELPGDVIILFALENTNLSSSAIVFVSGAVKSDLTEKNEVFTINWIVDGFSDEQFVEAGSEIILPHSPSKDGFAFIGWTPEVPDIMPANDLSFTAVFEKSYICPDCDNEIIGEDEINDHITAEAVKKITVKIKNNCGTKTINYGETLRLTANTSNMPADAKIFWFVDGVKKGEGTIFEVSPESGSVEVTVKVVDANGNNYAGADISDSQKVSVNSGFFRKIISFFKNLFGISRIVTQAFMVK